MTAKMPTVEQHDESFSRRYLLRGAVAVAAAIGAAGGLHGAIAQTDGTQGGDATGGDSVGGDGVGGAGTGGDANGGATTGGNTSG
ncbi:MAG: hypothetical protein ACRDJW_18965, partial [Thermomicrobiales bacterium]